MTTFPIETVAVIGACTMGQGIAQVCAAADFDVLLYDVRPDLIDRGINNIIRTLDALVAKGRLSSDEKDHILSRIGECTSMEKLEADLVIEAAVENIEVKKEIFSAIEKVNGPRTVFATNTSSLSVTAISSALGNPSRFAGLHFFNPAPVMNLVEIVSTATTSPETLQLLIDFTRDLGKVPVVAQDSPGFIVNRVARHFYVESLKVLEEGVTNYENIDQLMRATGFKMGPFELMDLIGIDINFAVTSSLYEAFHGDPKFRPSRIQQQKVLAGHLGRKSGKGFYEYT